jgi:hypothetical protein
MMTAATVPSTMLPCPYTRGTWVASAQMSTPPTPIVGKAARLARRTARHAPAALGFDATHPPPPKESMQAVCVRVRVVARTGGRLAMNSGTIIALDLGRHKSVACVFDRGTRAHAFRELGTAPGLVTQARCAAES